MKGDFTRDTFDRRNHFSRVLMQQGRVQLDADWNEQIAILMHYMRTLARDVLGPRAGPENHAGFEIITRKTANVAAKLKDLEPDDTERLAVLQEAIDRDEAVIGPGRYYVDGILVENERAILYSEQYGYPFSGAADLEEINDNLQKGLLYYLDVWERLITHVEDDHIREVALGGPDTCARAQVVWQVKVLFKQGEEGAFGCDAVDRLMPLGTGKLRARALLEKPPTELCVIPPESRYRGAENQLYRVEVHKGGDASGGEDSATFKWSRENGAVTFPIRSLTQTTAVLEHLGRDLRLGLKPGDWVEVVDDSIAVGETAGPLAQVAKVDGDERTVTLMLPEPVSALPSYSEDDMQTKHPLLRRWDHPGDVKKFGGALQVTGQADTDAGWIGLEDGVQIWFAKDGQFRAGDYWLIPARVATGDVDWPHELDGNGHPKLDDGNPIAAAVAPHGPRHSFAPLLLDPLGDAKDCRCRIDPLQCLA